MFVCGFAGLCSWPGLALAFFCVFSACLRFWPGKAVVFFLLRFLSARASGRAVVCVVLCVFLSSSLSPAGVFGSSRALDAIQYFVTSWI